MNLTIICDFFVVCFDLKETVAIMAIICILHQLQWENDLFVSRDFVRDKN